jgi:hypothetical protein
LSETAASELELVVSEPAVNELNEVERDPEKASGRVAVRSWIPLLFIFLQKRERDLNGTIG